MPLANYSFQFGSFVFGGASSPYQIQSVDGLESLPDLRTQDDNRGFNDGMFSGRDFLGGRTVTMEIFVFAGNGYSAQQNFDLLQAALIPQQTGTTALTYQLSVTDETRIVYSRVRTRRATIDKEYTFGYIRAQYSFFCPDPRYYSETLSTQSLIPTQTLGRTYDRTYDMTYGGGATGTIVYNTGNTTTYPTITLNGPITDPTISNGSTGEFITVQGTYLVTDTIVIDLLNKTITLNGSSARNLLLGTSKWFGAAPGYTTFAFSGSGYTIGTTSATVSYRSASI